MADDQKPADPVTENQNVLMMKPVKAFAYQDHEAHIAVHMAAMQDPKILQLLANNPLAPQLQASMMAHVNEHIGFQYRINIEQQMGTNLPAQRTDDMGEEEDINMTPEQEAQMAPMIAQAAQKLLAQSQMQAKQQQAQQQAQDPLIQMQQQEIQLKAAELERKKQKDIMDAAAKADQIEVEQSRIAAQKEIAGMQVGAKVAKDKEELASRNQLEGLRIGKDIARDRAQMAAPNRQKVQQPNKKGDD
jgi:hypothetical protein